MASSNCRDLVHTGNGSVAELSGSADLLDRILRPLTGLSGIPRGEDMISEIPYSTRSLLPILCLGRSVRNFGLPVRSARSSALLDPQLNAKGNQ